MNLSKNYRPSCSLYITLNKITGRNIRKKYPPIHRNASEKEPQATWLPHWQILTLPATGASQQKASEELEKSNNVHVIYLDFAKSTTTYY